MALASGSKLGIYVIESELGAGGMGEVYRARDERLHRTVAIKLLLPTLARRLETAAPAFCRRRGQSRRSTTPTSSLSMASARRMAGITW